jgi:hypothetical protein
MYMSISSLFADAGMRVEDGLQSRLIRLGVAHLLAEQPTDATIEVAMDFTAARQDDQTQTAPAGLAESDDQEPAALAKALQCGLLDDPAAEPSHQGDNQEPLVAAADDSAATWQIRPEETEQAPQFNTDPETWTPRRDDDGRRQLSLPMSILGENDLPELDIAICRMLHTDAWGFHLQLTLGF